MRNSICPNLCRYYKAGRREEPGCGGLVWLEARPDAHAALPPALAALAPDPERPLFGLAVCLVSHDLNLAGMFCHRLLLISQGKTLAQGTPEEVLTPDLLAQAYGVQVSVDREPSRGRPRVTLSAPRP